MKKKVLIDVPEGFDLRKYVALNSYDHQQWAHQIQSRLALQDCIADPVKPEDIAPFELKYTPEILLKNHIQNPLKQGSEICSGDPVRIIWPDTPTSTVYPIRVSDLSYEYLRLATGIADLKSKPVPEVLLWTLDHLDEDQHNVGVDELLSGGPEENHGIEVTLQICLEASDARIKEDFSNWLSMHRHATKTKPPLHTQKKLEQWAANRVLPARIAPFSICCGENVVANGGTMAANATCQESPITPTVASRTRQAMPINNFFIKLVPGGISAKRSQQRKLCYLYFQILL